MFRFGLIAAAAAAAMIFTAAAAMVIFRYYPAMLSAARSPKLKHWSTKIALTKASYVVAYSSHRYSVVKVQIQDSRNLRAYAGHLVEIQMSVWFGWLEENNGRINE